MKEKEMKAVAARIAKCEKILQESQDKKARVAAEKEIMSLSFGVGNLHDLDRIDELVQEILEKS